MKGAIVAVLLVSLASAEAGLFGGGNSKTEVKSGAGNLVFNILSLI